MALGWLAEGMYHFKHQLSMPGMSRLAILAAEATGGLGSCAGVLRAAVRPAIVAAWDLWAAY